MAYFGGIFFANTGGGGGQNYFHLHLAKYDINSFLQFQGRSYLTMGGSFLLTARSFLLTVGLCYLRWSFLLSG